PRIVPSPSREVSISLGRSPDALARRTPDFSHARESQSIGPSSDAGGSVLSPTPPSASLAGKGRAHATPSVRYIGTGPNTPPGPAIMAIQTRLLDVSAKLGPEFKSTIEILEQGPPIGIQERLTQSWQASSAELAGWQELVTKRATALEREMARLDGLRAIWTQTRTDAQASRAPTPVLENINTVIADLEAARVRL